MDRHVRRVTIAAFIAGGALVLGAMSVHRALARHRTHPTLFLPPQDETVSRSEYLLGVLAEAEADIASRRYDSALDKLFWFHENALDIDGASAGVRLSYALSDWRRLADVHPPALAKLEKVRREANESVRTASSAEEAFVAFLDASAINEALVKDEETHELFLELDTMRPEFARKIYRLVRDALIRRKEYAICGKYIQPDELAKSIRTMLEAMERIRQEDAGFGRYTENLLHDWVIDDCANDVALLVLNDRHEEAGTLVGMLQKEWSDRDFHAALDAALEGRLRVRG